MSVTSAVFEAGQVYLRTQAPWLPDLEAELFAFPGSRHDDQIDSISQALNHPSAIAAWIRFGAAMEERPKLRLASPGSPTELDFLRFFGCLITTISWF